MTDPKNRKDPLPADDEVDGLLESLTADYREEQPTVPIDPEPLVAPTKRPPDRPVPPPTEKPRMPRPGAGRIPRPGSENQTAQPPAVNPAGPPRREPFLPAMSPAPATARPAPKPPQKGLPGAASFDDSEIDAALMPLSFPPAAPSHPPAEVPTVAPPPGVDPASMGAEVAVPPPAALPADVESLDTLEAVEVPEPGDQAPPTRASASLGSAPPSVPSDGASVAPAISTEGASTFEDWDDDSVTSIVAGESDFITSEARVESDVPSLATVEIEEDAPRSPPTRPAAGLPLTGDPKPKVQVSTKGTSPDAPPSAHAPDDAADERPAALHLGDHRLIEAWVARAEWFEAEAQTTEDPLAKARLLIAASELWAMAGNTSRARDTAMRAAQAAPSIGFAARQARALAATEGDWKAVALALDAEARTAQTEAAKAHAAYVSAEVHRLALGDSQGSERRQSLLLRASPEDPRPYLMRLATELAASSAAPKLKWPELAAIAPLSAAASELSHLRTGHGAAGPRSRPMAFGDARRALGASDRGRAGAALRELGDVQGLGDGALYLAAALFAPSAETRPDAIRSLATLLERSPSAAIRRALAARALEQGDGAAMEKALAEGDTDAPTFGPDDRVSLSALAGGDDAALASAAEALVGNDELRPLAAAAMSASSVSASLPVGDPGTRAELTLGRRLATVAAPEDLKEAVHAVRAATPNGHLGRILALELDTAAGATTAVAAELTRLAPPEQATYGKLAAALLEEASGHGDLARRHYTGALSAADIAEAAARALLEPDDPSASDVLSTLASLLGDETTPRQALLLFEAAVRAGVENPSTTEDLLGRSHDASPNLPFAARLGGDLARSRGDVAKLLEWLRRQRDAARDPIARALDGVREALLVADDDPDRAASLLDEALSTHPDDAALHELAERLNPVPTLEWGNWRERLAERTDQTRVQAWLLFEAAMEYERQGAPVDAARAARSGAKTGESELLRMLAERLSPEVAEPALAGLPELRALEHGALTDGADEALLSVSRKLVELGDSREAGAHSRLAVRLAMKTDPWESARELVERALQNPPASLWSLRQASAHARVAGDDARLLETEKELQGHVPRPRDRATLALRAAEAAARLGRIEEARSLLGRTLETIPDHFVALDLRARLAEEAGDAKAAAEDVEAIAGASAIPEHQWEAWHRASILWLEKARDADRGLTALERAADLDVAKGDVFARLQALYVERGDRAKLAALLEARLAKTDAPEERIQLEVTRGRALADVGDREAARRALAAALDANPDHADALEVFAGLCLADGAFQNAEESFIRLARVVTDPEKQADIYGRLASLYDKELPNPARAEICYREILKRRPNDVPATQSLVHVYARLGQPAKAVQLQNELVERATTPEEKRDRTLGLALVYDEAAKDKKSAFTILDRARKAWPHDNTVLRAVAEAHQRHDETAAMNVLLDRAAAEARRALAHGRFEPAFFGILETAAQIRGNADAASVAGATLAALEGKPDVPVSGAGAAASRPELDDLLAPELLSPAIRALLKKLPSVLDNAYPVNMKALRATALPPSHAELAGEIRSVAESMGVRSLELLVSPALGSAAVPASCTPARIVVGQGLLDSEDDAARYFSLVRALKIIQGQAAAFTRIAPIDLWPATAALLSALSSGFQPQGVDAAKLADAKRRIGASIPSRRDDELATLALEIGGAIGNRASQLGQAVGQWASRTALLAIGSPSAALRGIALSVGQTEGPPTDPADRMKWVLRQPEAKDLTIFSVSEGYAEARRHVGLST